MPCPCCSPPSRCCGTCRDDSDCQPGCRCCCCGPGGLPRCVQDNGPCDPPESPGACCLPGGGCVDGVSQTECETCGNTFCVLTITLPSGEDCPATGPGGSVWVKCGNTCEAVIQSNSGCEGCDNYQGQEVSLPNGGTAAITARCEEEVGYCGEWHAGATCSTAPCSGTCCIDGACDPTYTTQEECEACETVNTCTEYLYLANPEDPCPEGWEGSGGFCYRTTTPASCEDCSGNCFSSQVGPCGEWQTCGGGCDAVDTCPGSATDICISIEGSGNVTLPANDTYGCQALEFPLFGPLPAGWFSGFFDPMAFMPSPFLINAAWPQSADEWSMSGLASGTLKRQCGKYVLSGSFGQFFIAPNTAFPNSPRGISAGVEFTASCCGVEDGACAVEGGLTCEGTLYWSAQTCFVSVGGMGSAPQVVASGSIPITVTISAGACR